MNALAYDSVVQVPVKNVDATNSPFSFYDLMFADGYLGTSAKAGDDTFLENDTNLIDIDERRIISTKDYTAGSYTVRTLCYFQTLTAKIVDADATGAVPAGIVYEIGADYLKIKLLPQNGQIVPTV